MPDVNGAILQGLSKAGMKEAVKRYGADGVQRLSGVDDPRRTKIAANFFSTVVDAVADTAKSGQISTATLLTALARNAGGFLGLSNDEKLACVGALLDMGVQGASFAGQIGVIGGEEFLTGGVATPLAIAQTAFVAKTAVDAANSAIKAGQQCGPFAVPGYQALTGQWGDVVKQGQDAMARLNDAFGKLPEDMQRAVQMNTTLF